MKSAILMLALVALSAQAPAPGAFLNVTLGESAQSVVARMGDPLIHRTQGTEDVVTDEYLYFAPSGKAVEYLEVAGGNVMGVRTIAAPKIEAPGPLPSALGIALEAPASALDALPKNTTTYKGHAAGGIVETHRGPDGLLYSFTYKPGGTVTQIAARLSPAAAAKLPAQPSPKLHDGMTAQDAVVVKAASEDAGNQFIGVFLSVHSCGQGEGYWKPAGPGVATAYEAHPMVKVEAECTAGGSRQVFWFDIRAIYGKSSG